MHKCSKCGEEYTKLIKGSRQCQPCRTKRHREYCKKTGYNKKRYQKIKESERERHLIRKYKITTSDYEEMFVDQQGKCAICDKEQERSFDVDHCHTTGEVRGLLCTSCNRFIGHASDSPERLRKAADYLESSRKSRQNL